MAGISSISSLLANITTADFSVTTGEATATSGSAATPPAGPVSIDFYQSTTEAQAADILQNGTGWTPLPGSFDETASEAVVTSSAGVEDIGTYADRSDHGIVFGGATWGGDRAGPADLTPTFTVELERDSPDSVSATITAADGTVSTVEITIPAATPAGPATPAASTPAASATVTSPVAATTPAAFTLPAFTPPAVTTTTIDGDSDLAFTFDAWGDFAATFSSFNKGAAAVIEATQSYSHALAVAPGSNLNVSG